LEVFVKKKKIWIGTIGGQLKPHENPPAVTTMSQKDFEKFIKLCERPGKPTAALRRLMKKI